MNKAQDRSTPVRMHGGTVVALFLSLISNSTRAGSSVAAEDANAAHGRISTAPEQQLSENPMAIGFTNHHTAVEATAVLVAILGRSSPGKGELVAA